MADQDRRRVVALELRGQFVDQRMPVVVQRKTRVVAEHGADTHFEVTAQVREQPDVGARRITVSMGEVQQWFGHDGGRERKRRPL